MNLNRLYSIFGSDRLGRKDVKTYGQSTDETVRNSIEQKSAGSSFDSDAMEGWEELSFDTGAMTNLDKKFGTSSTPDLYKILGGTTAVAALTVSVYFLFFNNPQPTTVIAKSTTPEVITTLLEDQEITLDESDMVIPEPIELMKTVPVAKQFEPQEIIKDYEERIVLQEEKPEIPIEELAPLVLIPEGPAPEIIRDHKLAKEVYLYSMKLVDYRKYRLKPSIKTRQITLTGTPADQEGRESKVIDPIWKDVDVPYIEYVKKSMRIFERSNFKKALTRFETIIETYGNDVNGNFYAGICLYNLGEYDKAIGHFSICLNGRFSNFDEEALWMKAESYDLSGNKEEATTLYKEISEENGYYAPQAKRRLLD